MTRIRTFLALGAFALAVSAVGAGAAHADWIDPYGVVHGCRTFVNPYTGFWFTRCF
jgi:hypothetical protein